jgi:hypothetical protein
LVGQFRLELSVNLRWNTQLASPFLSQEIDRAKEMITI